MKKEFFVGIDISKDTFYVCIKQQVDTQITIKGTHSFEQSNAGYIKFLSWVLSKTKNGEPLYVMEATGIYHEELTYFLYSSGKTVAIVLANKIKHFAKSLNVKTKTDKADAQMIAQYGIERNPKPWQPMMSQMKNLRDLCRERLALKKDLVRCKCQAHAMKHAHSKLDMVVQIKEQQIDFLENNIQLIENEIVNITKQDRDFYERVQKIETINGVRLITIVTVLCETNGFDQFNNMRQVVSFAGLDVAERQSGLYKGYSKISKKGNSRIRQCLFMPALTATNHNDKIIALYQRVVERNPTIKMKGVVAGMRKLLILIFVLWRKNETYNPNYQWNGH